MQTQKTLLKTTRLGETGLEMIRVGFGAWGIGGGGWEFGWGSQADDESIAAIHHALDLGVNWIDAAAVYGFGRSEQVVGRAGEGLGAGQRPLVFSKASLLEGPGGRVVNNLKRDSIVAGSRGKPAPAPGRRDRPLPDPFGPSRTRTSRKAGPRSPSSRSRAGCGTSACPTSASSSYGGHSGSLRSKPCSRPTH